MKQIYFVSTLLLLISCSDISKVTTGEIRVSPQEVVFRDLAPGSRLGVETVEVRNIGNARIGIMAMRLEEQDERLELNIVDEDDHQGARFLAPDEAEFVSLEWRVLDAQADEARFIVTLADGSEVAVPVRTPDIDPRIQVTADPMGMPTEEGLTVSFLDAAPSQFQSVVITVSSQSIAALEIDTLCLLSPSGDCVLNNQDGGFMICNGRPLEPGGCMPLLPPADALGFEDEYTFTAFYQPGENDVDRISRQVLIESNARTPSFFVSFVGEPCIRMTPSDVCGLCGDGEVSSSEECDDGNLNPADECTNTCTLPVCGDNVVQGGEECDDGNMNDTDPCTNACTNAVCGDGVVFDGVEACDDGNDIDDDDCTNTCQSAGCGDGVVQEGEACDDGNADETDGCTSACVIVVCGDMVLQGEETCDDGNQITETCAYGEPNCQVCDSTCNLVPGNTSYCGDMRLDSNAGETCDDGNFALEACDYGLESCSVCDANCRNTAGAVSYCGDGVVDASNGETCEPGGETTCDFGSGLVFFDRLADVPSPTEDALYIVDVHGIDAASKARIINEGHLLNFEESFALQAVTDIEAASQMGNLIESREYLLIATLNSDFYEPGAANNREHSFQINNTTAMVGSNYHDVDFDAYWTAPARNVAVAFVPIDMFANGYYATATLSTYTSDGNRAYAQTAQGDDLTLTYNYTFDTECRALTSAGDCIAVGQPNECTQGEVEPIDPCDTANPPAECNEDPGFGRYVLNPILTHRCTFSGIAIVDLALSQLDFIEDGNTLRIQIPPNQSQPSFPPQGLTQTPIPMDGNFNATATISGGCQEDVRLSGAFTDMTRSEWNGDFEICFTETDGFSCQLTSECGSGSCFNYPVSGQRVGTP
jgi:cysteine-rich repeat protein